MLRDRWYPILEAAKLRKKSIGIKRFGENLVLWRDASGAPTVLQASCPHRGASLAGGRVIDGEIECPWHGFRFSDAGRCTLMPCEGPDARIPKALALPVYPVREAHDLIWMWWGDERASYPEIPFYTDIEAHAGFTDASYILPYHYSRMIETNLDIHHTPFVHGNVVPVGTRMVDFDARVSDDGNRITSTGSLVREKKAAAGDLTGMPFRADLILPNLGLVVLTPNLHLIVCATPVDDESSWLWFRYRQTYTRNPMLGKLISWIAVHSELRIVQKQDWRLFSTLAPGTVDDVHYSLVHSDKAIALYRQLRSAELNKHAARDASPRLHEPMRPQRSVAAN